MNTTSEISDHLSHSADNFEFELSIKNKGLKLEDAQSCEDLCQKIREQKCIKVLRLEGNTLGVEAALYIGKALKGHKELERLILNDIFTGRLKTEIPKALENLFCEIRNSDVNLVELNLSDNAFGPIGMSSLMTILKSPCCRNLKELRLHNNGLGIQGAKRLADVLKHMSIGSRKLVLKTFICGRNRLENEGASAIASALQNACDLEEIQMPQNGICAEGAISIFKSLENHLKIRLINFNDNTISTMGSLYISKVLPNLANLEHLNIGDCLIQDQGTHEIAAAIVGLEKLKSLNMSSNEIEDEAGLVLLDSIKACPSLSSVNLDNNNFSEPVKKRIQQELNQLGVKVSLRDDAEEEEAAHGGEEAESFKSPQKMPPLFPVFGGSSQQSLFGTKLGGSFNKGNIPTNTSLPLFPMINPSAESFSLNKTSNNIEPLFNKEGKCVARENTKHENTKQDTQEQEAKQIKKVRRKLSSTQSTPAMPSNARPSMKNVDFYFEMITTRQKCLNPSQLDTYLQGMLSAACLFNRPGLANVHFHSFLDETIQRLGNDYQKQMAAADTLVHSIKYLKSSELQRKQIEMMKQFVINHSCWNEEARMLLKSGIESILDNASER